MYREFPPEPNFLPSFICFSFSTYSCAVGQIVRQGIMMVGPNVSRQFCQRPGAALGLAALVMVTGIASIVASQAAELTPRDMVLLDRLTWGISTSSAAHLQRIGA